MKLKLEYEGVVYRPPSEARSLIIQVTIGCAHNKCSFCSMYKSKKFRIRSLEDVYTDLYEARETFNHIERIFLADGDALVLGMDRLRKICTKIRELFPECRRISAYSTPLDILRKSKEDLEELKSFGFGMLYMGVESGSDIVLERIKKGVTSKEIIEAGRKIKESGIKLSITFISGIGGEELLHEHAKKSAQIINSIDPDYVGLLTLMIDKETEIFNEINLGKFKILDPEKIMFETRELIFNIKSVSNCVFRSNHASNYVALRGTLPQDKEMLLDLIDSVLKQKQGYRPEQFRRL